MKKQLLALGAAGMLMLSGCRENPGECVNRTRNWNAQLFTYCIDSTQTYQVNTYNDYYFIGYDAIENEDGTITITLVIGQPNISGNN